MKKTMIFSLALLFSTSVFAGADHYVRKEGGHVQHLKITKQKGDVDVLVDVDFDPTGAETDRPCSAQISGEAKVVSDTELTLKKQAQGEAHYCQLNIKLEGDEARIEESQDCARYFSGGFCRFGSEGKALKKIQ
ncbi:hypothetical protein [Methylococcus sp. EFPC2]|uniref:hypothetical protein n=1 Tax=Methylococcus sp. EFPC2 TaxID=2812648 RepID=UPI001967EEE1|nr:hypothetical protein [Methylococcus sp. EFPC2]QSA97184.1 hypothetical protein JWZ97_18665 [Methylococcus sp. EFPC2]